jgi:hypothetical protein
MIVSAAGRWGTHPVWRNNALIFSGIKGKRKKRWTHQDEVIVQAGFDLVDAGGTTFA